MLDDAGINQYTTHRAVASTAARVRSAPRARLETGEVAAAAAAPTSSPAAEAAAAGPCPSASASSPSAASRSLICGGARPLLHEMMKGDRGTEESMSLPNLRSAPARAPRRGTDPLFAKKRTQRTRWTTDTATARFSLCLKQAERKKINWSDTARRRSTGSEGQSRRLSAKRTCRRTVLLSERPPATRWTSARSSLA